MTAEESAALQAEIRRRISAPASQVIAEMNRATAGWPTNEQCMRAFASALSRIYSR